MSPNRIKHLSKGMSLKLASWIVSIIAFLISGALIFSSIFLTIEYVDVNRSTQKFLDMKDVASEVQLASDHLTDQVRTFVVTHDEQYMKHYFKEIETERRQNALNKIHDNILDSEAHEEVHTYIEAAIQESTDLENLEYFAMKLICVEHSIDYSKYQKVIDADISSVTEDKDEAAIKAVYGTEYLDRKNRITTNITTAVHKLDEAMEKTVIDSTNKLKVMMYFQSAIIFANIVFIAAAIILMHLYIVSPMNKAVVSLLDNKDIKVRSNKEFNYLADTFNVIRTQNEHVKEKLIYEAEHDKLTGLYNRTGYDTLYRRIKLNKAIYVLLDIDKFKEVNDTLGHEMGDKVLSRTAHILDKYFNDDNSYVFRIGGDEFAVLIENVNPSMNQDILNKCQKMNAEISKKEGKIPGTPLSIGVAYGEDNDTTDTLFKKADIALYEVKNKGRADVKLFQK